MKIRLSDSTGRPEPQFVVEAENEEDRLFLKMFIYSPLYSKDKLIFHLHGHSGSNTGISSFNFGWVKKNEIEEISDLFMKPKENQTQNPIDPSFPFQPDPDPDELNITTSNQH